jgi:hypothetical protein
MEGEDDSTDLRVQLQAQFARTFFNTPKQKSSGKKKSPTFLSL